jgi:hypothetical protein
MQESVGQQMQIDQIPRALCHSLLLKLREDGVVDLPGHDARIDAALGDVLGFVEEQCRQADKAGSTQFVDECLYVLDKLGPDAATGRHDLFWAQIRELQPGSLSFGNPNYKTASLVDHLTEDPAYELSDNWQQIVRSSATNLVAALRR